MSTPVHKTGGSSRNPPASPQGRYDLSRSRRLPSRGDSGQVATSGPCALPQFGHCQPALNGVNSGRRRPWGGSATNCRLRSSRNGLRASGSTGSMPSRMPRARRLISSVVKGASFGPKSRLPAFGSALLQALLLSRCSHLLHHAVDVLGYDVNLAVIYDSERHSHCRTQERAHQRN